MIKTKELLYAIDMRLNKIASLKNQAIPVANKIIALNDSILKVLSSKVNINNVYKAGFQSFLSRFSELEVLTVKEEKVTPHMHKDVYTTYRVNTSELSYPIYFPLAIVGEAKRSGCENRIINSPRLNKHADMPLLMGDSNYCPSFRFQETLSTFQDGVIDMYTDDPEGSFEIDKMYISYLRYPKRVDIGGYKHFDGSLSTDVDCELPMSLKDDIVTIAVTELAYSTGNAEIIQSNIINNDKYR